MLDWVRSRSALYRGALLNTILRNDTYYFSQIGTFIERADSTARILDVKYYHLLPPSEMVGSGQGQLPMGGAVAISFCAPKLSLGIQRSITAVKIAEFMILNRQMPRSLRACYDELTVALCDLAVFYGAKYDCHTTADATRRSSSRLRHPKNIRAGLA